ncbi:MAG: hypothetical protein ACR2QC_10630 [Gammaproteobacteria bacterium]
MFTFIFHINHPSHSCEGRNLRAEGANCKESTITRRFETAEIPAFAGMGQRGRNEIPAFAGMAYFFAGMAYFN